MAILSDKNISAKEFEKHSNKYLETGKNVSFKNNHHSNNNYRRTRNDKKEQ